MAKAVVRLGAEGYRTEMLARDHVFYADEPASEGGSDTAPTPTEMVLGALGACIAITARLYAQRKGWPLEGVDITLDIERFTGSDYPGYSGDAKFIHEVKDQIVFYGPLDEDQRLRLLDIAGRCPVHRIIENPAVFVEELLAAEEGLQGKV